MRERDREREVREDQQRRKDYFLPLESEAEGRVAKLDKSGQKTDKKADFYPDLFSLSLSFFLFFSFYWFLASSGFFGCPILKKEKKIVRMKKQKIKKIKPGQKLFMISYNLISWLLDLIF